MSFSSKLLIVAGFCNSAKSNKSSRVTEMAETSFLQPHAMTKARSQKRKRGKPRKKELKKQEFRLKEHSGGTESVKFEQQGKCRRWVRELSRISAWYMAINYILRKARAFYNELCCENYDDSFQGKETMLIASPYFSVPVIPPPNIAQVM